MINPIKVLPRITPAPLPTGEESRMGERVMLELIQNELANKRFNYQAGVQAEEKLMELLQTTDKTSGLNPNIAYQKKGLDALNNLKSQAINEMRSAGGDLPRINKARQDFMVGLSSNEDILGAMEDAATMKEFGKAAIALGDRGDPNAIQRVLGEFSKERNKPIGYTDLNVGGLALNIDDYGNKFLDARQSENEEITRDPETGRIMAVSATKSIGDRAENERALLDHYRGNAGLKATFTDTELEAKAKIVVDNRMRKLSGTKIDSLKGSPTARATAKTIEEKLREKFDGGEAIKIITPGYGSAQKDDNGDVSIYDTAGNRVGYVEEVWDAMNEKDKQELRRRGHGQDKYVIKGSNMKINGGSINHDIPMNSGSLNKADADYATKSGVTSKAEVVENDDGTAYLETNNPSVLADRAGLTLSEEPVDPKKPNGEWHYVVTDRGGKKYPESKDGKGIFATRGGNGKERFFKVRIEEIKKDDAATTPADPAKPAATDPAPVDPAKPADDSAKPADNPVTPPADSTNSSWKAKPLNQPPADSSQQQQAPPPSEAAAPPAQGQTGTEEQSVEVNGFVFTKDKDGVYRYEPDSDKEFTGTADEVHAAWEKKYGKGKPDTPAQKTDSIPQAKQPDQVKINDGSEEESKPDSTATKPKADAPKKAVKPYTAPWEGQGKYKKATVEIDGFVFTKTNDGYEYESDKDYPGTREDIDKAWEKKYGKPPAEPKAAEPAKGKTPDSNAGGLYNKSYNKSTEVKKTNEPTDRYGRPIKKAAPKVDTPPPIPASKTPDTPKVVAPAKPLKRVGGTSSVDMDEGWYGKEIKKPSLQKNDAPALPEVNQSKLPERHFKGDRQSESQWKEVNNPSNTDFEKQFAEVEKDKGVKIVYDSTDVKDSIDKGYFSNHAASAIIDLAGLAKERKVNELRITGYIHHITRDNKKPHNFDLGMNPEKDSMKGMFFDEGGRHSTLLPETVRWLKKHGYALVIENNSYSDWFDKSSIYGNLKNGELYFRPEAKGANGNARGPHYSFEYVGTK